MTLKIMLLKIRVWRAKKEGGVKYLDLIEQLIKLQKEVGDKDVSKWQQSRCGCTK